MARSWFHGDAPPQPCCAATRWCCPSCWTSATTASATDRFVLPRGATPGYAPPELGPRAHRPAAWMDLLSSCGVVPWSCSGRGSPQGCLIQPASWRWAEWIGGSIPPFQAAIETPDQRRSRPAFSSAGQCPGRRFQQLPMPRRHRGRCPGPDRTVGSGLPRRQRPGPAQQHQLPKPQQQRPEQLRRPSRCRRWLARIAPGRTKGRLSKERLWPPGGGPWRSPPWWESVWLVASGPLPAAPSRHPGRRFTAAASFPPACTRRVDQRQRWLNRLRALQGDRALRSSSWWDPGLLAPVSPSGVGACRRWSEDAAPCAGCGMKLAEDWLVAAWRRLPLSLRSRLGGFSAGRLGSPAAAVWPGQGLRPARCCGSGCPAMPRTCCQAAPARTSHPSPGDSSGSRLLNKTLEKPENRIDRGRFPEQARIRFGPHFRPAARGVSRNPSAQGLPTHPSGVNGSR